MNPMQERLGVRTHVITGERSEVSAVLARARLDGRLVDVTEAQLIGSGRVRVVTRLRSAGPSRWRRVRPWLFGALKVTGVLLALAAVAALVWALVSLVMTVVALVAAAVAWVHAHLVGIAMWFVVAVIVLVMCSSSGHRCVGVHCRGCRR